MPSLLRPPQRQHFPPGVPNIDCSHPLANGLIGCYLPGLSYGLNLVATGGDMTPSGGYVTAVSRDGPALALEAVGTRMSVTAPALFKTFTNGAALFWRGQLRNTPSNYPTLIGVSYDNAGGAPFSVISLHRRPASGDVAAQSNSAGIEVLSPLYTAGTFIDESIGGSFTPGGNVELFVGGISRGTTAMASAPNSTATSILGFGVDLTAVSDVPNQYPNVGYVWNRPLNAAEQATLAADPYCLLISDEAEMPAMFFAGTTYAGFGIPQLDGRSFTQMIGY